MSVDQLIVAEQLQEYRQLAPEIAALDEDRYQLSGEETMALDRLMADPTLREPIAAAIVRLDQGKRIGFRLFFIEALVWVTGVGLAKHIPEPWHHLAKAYWVFPAIFYAWILRPLLIKQLARWW